MEELNRKYLAAHPELADKVVVGTQNTDKVGHFFRINFLPYLVTYKKKF